MSFTTFIFYVGIFDFTGETDTGEKEKNPNISHSTWFPNLLYYLYVAKLKNVIETC